MDENNTTTTEQVDTPELDYKAEYERIKAENARLSAAKDKAASEAADYKKQLRARQSEEEAQQADRAAKDKEMEEKYNELLRKSTIADHTARYMALGYSEKLAKEAAEALYDGDTEKLFTVQRSASEELEQKRKAELMRGNPRPDGSGGSEDKSEAEKIAETLGKNRAESEKASADILSKYIRRT